MLFIYYCRENLANDSYLVSQMDADQYVPISTVAGFNQVKRMTTNMDLVIEVLRGKLQAVRVTGLPHVWKMSGKHKFSLGQGKVRNFFKISGNFGHLTHVRELSGNFVMTLFLDWNFYHIIRPLPGFCLCKCLLGKFNLKVYWLLLLNFLPFKNPVGGGD